MMSNSLINLSDNLWDAMTFSVIQLEWSPWIAGFVQFFQFSCLQDDPKQKRQ